MIRPLLIASCLTLAAAAAGSVAAQDPAPAVAPATPAAVTPTAVVQFVGDIAKGKQLTYTCQGCHGIPGYKNAYPNFHVPRIGGQSPQYLSSALSEYKLGKRKHPTMQAQAESFSDQDIADIAAFLSSVK